MKNTLKNNRKNLKLTTLGFTLMELLAVIVILAVIGLITIPIVSGVIERSKKASLKESANGLIEEVGYYYMQYGVVDNVRFDIEENQINNIEGNTLKFKGYVEDATVLINTKGEIAICINDGEYSVYKNYRDNKVIEIDNKNCNIPTGQAVVYLENESTITEYTNAELTELVQSLQQEITALKNSTDGNPIGTVISYMASSTAPAGYLPCDGAVYNISDYPALATTIKDGLGSYNYYGGDGTTTFAVPDLRGEFLRGTGTNSRTNEGSGSNVGVHQSATIAPYMRTDDTSNGRIFMTQNKNEGSSGYKNFDNTINMSLMSDVLVREINNLTVYTPVSTSTIGYTTRPTNTSVLYCIKY